MRAFSLLLGAGILIGTSSPICVAQSGAFISGPSIGFTSDAEGQTIRPLLGILGASIPGDPLTLPEGIVHGTISPRHDYALAIASSTGQPVVVRLTTPDLSMASLAGRPPDSEWIAISPTGSAAALYGKESRRLQLVSGLPASPEVTFEFDTNLLGGGNVSSVAVSDDAKLALINVGDQVRTLWVVNGNGTPSPLTASQPSKMAFIANRHDVLVADDGSREVFLIQSIDDNPVRLPGIVLRDSDRAISAVAASTDGNTIFVAQEGSPEITITDLQTRISTVVSCPCTPTVFAPMQGTSVFRLNNLSNGPIAILDASSFPSQPPRTLLIPLNRGDSGKGESQ